MANNLCREYLMHAKKSAMNYGSGQFAAPAKSAMNYGDSRFRNTSGINTYTDPRYKPMTKSAQEQYNKKRMSEWAQKQNRGLLGKVFDKVAYMKQYYQDHKKDYQPGGKYYYYDATKSKVRNALGKLTKLGESVYDKTHKGEYDAFAGGTTYAKNLSSAGVQRRPGDNANVRGGTHLVVDSGTSKEHVVRGSNPNIHDWGPEDIRVATTQKKRRADSRFIQSGGVGPTMTRRR